MADGVIVGSAIVNVIEANLDKPDSLIPAVGDFAASLVQAVKNV